MARLLSPLALLAFGSGACSGTAVVQENQPAPPTACTWTAQDDTTVVCHPKSEPCKGPAGSDWCNLCTCTDPALNRYSCTAWACSIPTCTAQPQIMTPGGCSFAFDNCSNSRTYQVICNAGMCQCQVLDKGMTEPGNKTTENLCSVTPAKQLTTFKQLCGWPIVIK